MNFKNYWLIIFCISNVLFAQKNNLESYVIPENLLENANSIILSQDIQISVKSQKSFTIKKNKKVKVFNQYGLKNIDALEYYDKSIKVNSIKAVLYDGNGLKIKKYDKQDFTDASIANGFSVFTDNRIIYLNFTPIDYPFIIEFESYIDNDNTAFIPSWLPLDDYYESVLNSNFSITYPAELGFRFKEDNFNGYSISSNKTEFSSHYNAQNLAAIKKEEYSPSFIKLVPIVLVAFEKFQLEGVDGSASTWQEFGSWINQKLLFKTDDISDETKKRIIDLVGSETNPINKAKIIYNYVQNKVRYVSIKMGIGGWKPMNASDVDRLGYGDCKALSNYTKSLLNAVDVPSYYTIIYGDSTKKDIDQDFVSMQGNHAILTIPFQGNLYPLECTSQSAPFGFAGDFTDDRMALVIKPDGGEIIKTTNYNEKLSKQSENGNYDINEDGSIKGTLKIISTGVQYNDKYFLESAIPTKIVEYYKLFFSEINNLKIENTTFENDKNSFQFIENITLTATNYCSFSGNLIIFPINAYNRCSSIPQRYRNRINQFEQQRGFYDEDEIEINLPIGYTLDGKPEDNDIKNIFGEFKTSIEIISPSKLKYKRSFFMKKGNFDKSEYDNFRKFMEQVAKADNSKVIITKKI